MLIVTTHNIPGFSITDNLGIIATNQVVGANVISDFIASFSDFFGGTSGAYRNKLDQLFQYAKKQLSEKALSMGANAILGFKIEYDEISGKGKSMFMVTCIGTAVIIAPNFYEKFEKLHSLKNFLKEGIISNEEYEMEKITIDKMYNIKMLDKDLFIDDFDDENQSYSNVVTESDEVGDSPDNLCELDVDVNAKEEISKQIDKLWMMSVEGIENCESPSFFKGKNIDERITELICESRFNEAGKLCCVSRHMNAEEAYNYIMAICVSANE